ncbi:FG-GAP repeat domain-containing protein [Dactylosporangium sp. CA-092794]|uniref:FG-GAP repeat domain-containing protein n=1 Tax=Dactylosporangium sp. CA-092794 TaxID=3239929 RepID=UPI003D8E932A
MQISRLGHTAVALGLGLAMAVTTGAPASASGTYSFAGVTDWDNDGNTDIVARDPNGDLWLFPGESTRAPSSAKPAQIGSGWNGYTFTGLADWDNDGNQDIIARTVSGDLLLFPGASLRGVATTPPVQIGLGWNGYTFVGLADWDKDGNTDIVARDLSGELWLFPGQSIRGYSTAAPVRLGSGWNGLDFAGIADWDKDGNTDIIARGTLGELFLFPGESTRAPSTQPQVQIGTGWNGYDFAGVTDWDNDGNQDILARMTNNDLWLYPGESTRALSGQPPVQIGTGW